jgi:hypothetical protein
MLAFSFGIPTSVPVGGNLGTINVNVQNTAAALIGSPSEPVTLTVTGPADFSQIVSSSAGVASFNLNGVRLKTPGIYSLTANSSNLSGARTSFSVVAAPTVVITTTATLKAVSGGYQATIKVTNSGTLPAANVRLTSASLGTATGSPLPLNLGTLAASGGWATVIVTFPASAGSGGAGAVEKYTGTYTGGTFASSIRAVLP